MYVWIFRSVIESIHPKYSGQIFLLSSESNQLIPCKDGDRSGRWISLSYRVKYEIKFN